LNEQKLKSGRKVREKGAFHSQVLKRRLRAVMSEEASRRQGLEYEGGKPFRYPLSTTIYQAL
jgi:hypothetical protein